MQRLGGGAREREVARWKPGAPQRRPSSRAARHAHAARVALGGAARLRRAPRGRARADDERRAAAARTASFSRAMSATVGPSQRVCSRPTFVSTATGAREHVRRVVAPAEAGLDDRDLDARAGELDERGGGQQLELGHAVALAERAVDLRGGRAPRAAPRRANASGSRSSSPTRMRSVNDAQVRRQVGAGAHAVALEDRGGHAHGRATCRSCRRRGSTRKRSCGRPSAVEQPAHAVQAEAHAEQLEREQVLAPRRSARPGAHSASSSARRRASFSRSASTTAGGALATNPSLASLRSARCDLARRARRGAPRARPLGGLEVDVLGAAARATAPPGTRDASPRARRRPRVQAKRASRAICSAVRLVAVGEQPRRQTAPGRAPTASRQRAQRLHGRDRARRSPPRRPRRRSASSAAGQRAPQQQPLGRRAVRPQISSVTNGITGWAIASVSRSTCSSVAATSACSSSRRTAAA